MNKFPDISVFTDASRFCGVYFSLSQLHPAPESKRAERAKASDCQCQALLLK